MAHIYFLMIGLKTDKANLELMKQSKENDVLKVKAELTELQKEMTSLEKQMEIREQQCHKQANELIVVTGENDKLQSKVI